MLRVAALAIGLLTGGVLADRIATAQAGVGLSDLPALARARNERLRPKMIAALAPYLKDFELDYSAAANRQYLDRRIEEAAALGDSVVPLLLEKLAPGEGNFDRVHLAANCARVLRRLEPAGFLRPLLDLAAGTDPHARAHAIHLLGLSGHPEAATYLDAALPTLKGTLQGDAIRALHELRHAPSAAKVAAILANARGGLRRDCLRFLAAFGEADATPQVLAAMASDQGDASLGEYLRFLARKAQGNPAAATALLPLLDSGKLLAPDQAEVVQALATVAPEAHEPTIERLRAIIQGGEMHELGRACASTLLALGDKNGRRDLMEALDREVKKSPKVPFVLANRADAYFLFERWNEALRDYTEARKHLNSTAMRKEIGLKVAHCQFKLRQYRRVVQALRDAGAVRSDLELWAQDDAAFRDALTDQVDLRSYARELSGR